jgi:hypothetical protein
VKLPFVRIDGGVVFDVHAESFAGAVADRSRRVVFEFGCTAEPGQKRQGFVHSNANEQHHEVALGSGGPTAREDLFFSSAFPSGLG